MKRLALLVLALSFLLFGTGTQAASTHPATFVWKDDAGSGRQELVLFRRSISVTSTPAQAELHVFADSRYHLYVNGTHLAFGPGRFYPAHPEHDTFDLRPHLRAGENVIAVEVLTNGTETFQLPLSRGGFIAWGRIGSGEGSIDLSTPGSWLMAVPGSFEPQTPRFSFAKGPVEVRDLRREPEGWMLPGFDASRWLHPVPLARQDHWGTLTPRTIPALTQDPRHALWITGMYPVRRDETVLRFSVKAPDETRELYNGADRFPVVASTNIWSPREQVVTVGGWWGTYQVNGAGPLRQAPDPVQYARTNLTFALTEGWNAFFFRQDTVWGGFDFFLSVPASAGLEFSPRRVRGDSVFAHVLLPKTAEDRSLLRKHVARVESSEAVPAEVASLWQPVTGRDPVPNPAREIAWTPLDLGAAIRSPAALRLPLKVEGSAVITADMGRTTLGPIFAELDAPAGTRVDLGWSEDLNTDGLPALFKREMVNAGARFITGHGPRRYTTFKPYGARHLIARIQVPDGASALLRGLGQVEQVYPFHKVGEFACSNPMFDRIWEMGWRTLRVCAEDSYTDTPFRERGLYAGDLLPQYAMTLAVSGDSRLARRCLLLFQDMYAADLLEGAETHLNDYVLKTLLAVDWYARATGDWGLVARVLPNYRTYMEHLEARRVAGGYYRAGRTFIEWTQIDKYADLTAYQCLVEASLRAMERLTAHFGDTGQAAIYRARADDLERVIRREFWDPAHGTFHDGFKDGRPIDHRFAISSAYPLLFDIASPEQASSAAAYIMRDLQDIGTVSRRQRIHPYGAFFMLAAMFNRGEAAFAEEFMLKHWSPMIRDFDDTAWENFDPGGREHGGIGTRSHAWTGHPTWFLSTEVLGVRLPFLDEFDPKVIRIEPQSATLEWARGTVPHPAGLVSVEWRLKGERLALRVEAPAAVEVRVAPRGRLAEYPLDLDIVRRP